MTNRLDWFPCYPSKLLGALASMKPDRGYVYLIVLLRIYETAGPCRDTIEALATRTRLNKRVVSEALDVLFREGKLVRDGDGIHNPVAQQTLADQTARVKSASGAGKAGAEKRWGKTKRNQTKWHSNPNGHPNAKALPLDAHLQKQEQIEVDSKTDSPPASAAGLFVLEEQERSDWPKNFQDEFWAIYPRRTARADAMRGLDKLRKARSVTWARLMDGVRRYAEHARHMEQRYIKHPATWLNGGCWDDELEPPRGPPQGGGAPATKNGRAAIAARFAEQRRNEANGRADSKPEFSGFDEDPLPADEDAGVRRIPPNRH